MRAARHDAFDIGRAARAGDQIDIARNGQDRARKRRSPPVAARDFWRRARQDDEGGEIRRGSALRGWNERPASRSRPRRTSAIPTATALSGRKGAPGRKSPQSRLLQARIGLEGKIRRQGIGGGITRHGGGQIGQATRRARRVAPTFSLLARAANKAARSSLLQRRQGPFHRLRTGLRFGRDGGRRRAFGARLADRGENLFARAHVPAPLPRSWSKNFAGAVWENRASRSSPNRAAARKSSPPWRTAAGRAGRKPAPAGKAWAARRKRPRS